MTGIIDDHCTAAPELFYSACCQQHDREYATGLDGSGQPITRFQSDMAFLKCCKERRKFYPITGLVIPWMYFLAVRIFGGRRWLTK